MLQSIIGAFGKGRVIPRVIVDGKSISPGYNYPKWTKSVRGDCSSFKSNTDSFAGVSRIFSHTRLACSYKGGEKDVHVLRPSKDRRASRSPQVSSSFFRSRTPGRVLITSVYPSLRTCVPNTLGLENADVSHEVVMILRVYALYNRSIRIFALLMTLWTMQVTVSAIGITTGFGECVLPQIP